MEIDYNIYPLKPVPITYNARSFTYPSQHGKCYWCGSELTGRRKSYCSKECYTEYYGNFDWKFLRIKMLRRDNFQCVKCKGLANQVDHKIAIMNGGDFFDHSNLQTLCNKCHGAKTGMDRIINNTYKKVHDNNNKKLKDFY